MRNSDAFVSPYLLRPLRRYEDVVREATHRSRRSTGRMAQTPTGARSPETRNGATGACVSNGEGET